MSQVLPDLERVSEHITTHGQRLLQLARPGPDHVAPIALATVIDDVVQMLRGAGKLRRIDVDTVFGDRAITVTVNRTRIEQILVNLIVNAVDAIRPNGGGIAITVAPSADGKRVICEVADSGGGIPAETLAKIFDPFFTTKEHGTGLGPAGGARDRQQLRRRPQGEVDARRRHRVHLRSAPLTRTSAR